MVCKYREKTNSPGRFRTVIEPKLLILIPLAQKFLAEGFFSYYIILTSFFLLFCLLKSPFRGGGDVSGDGSGGGWGGDAVSLFVDASKKKILVLLSSSVERFGVSRMRDFFNPCLSFAILRDIPFLNDKYIKKKIRKSKKLLINVFFICLFLKKGFFHKQAILLVMLFKEIILQPELCKPYLSRIPSGHPERYRRSRNDKQKFV